jgi:hypothetical protein
MPSPAIAAQIQAIPATLSLTPYGISHLVAAETDYTERERMACEKRWQQWGKGRNLKRLETLESDLNALGYGIKISRL